ncbi:hypothetical protein ACXYMO_08325 [Arenibacterium sp. CAU 1754]
MPTEAYIVQSECKFHAVVTASSIAHESALDEILVDLDRALDILKDNLETDGVLAHALCLQVAGIEPDKGAYKSEGMGDELHDPWTSFCPAFWTKLIATPSLEPRLAQFLEKLRGLLEYGNNTLCFPMSEGDETQFGEPLLAHLTLTDPRFIPNYMAFLRLWDMDHEVEISGAILEILETYPDDANAKALREYCLEVFAGTDLAEQL